MTVTPTGLAEVNDPLTQPADGTVTEAEIEDLNSDGFPEVFVYVQSADGATSCIGYANNNGKSMSLINIPPVSSVPEATEGYRGHDEFRVVETSLVQRFPVYKEGDSDDAPSGGTRQIQWKLVPGEATWQMTAAKVENY